MRNPLGEKATLFKYNKASSSSHEIDSNNFDVMWMVHMLPSFINLNVSMKLNFDVNVKGAYAP